ncbi:MAG: hypothetical protein WBC05_04345, partial [Sedimentisphaerales bacterium]
TCRGRPALESRAGSPRHCAVDLRMAKQGRYTINRVGKNGICPPYECRHGLCHPESLRFDRDSMNVRESVARGIDLSPAMPLANVSRASYSPIAGKMPATQWVAASSRLSFIGMGMACPRLNTYFAGMTSRTGHFE